MMKKTLAWILVLLMFVALGFLAWGYLTRVRIVSDVPHEIVFNPESESGQSAKPTVFTKEEKVQQFKRRMNFRSIIRKGDFYSVKNMKDSALQYYLSAYKKLPNDHVIEKKIADTYFEMKQFQKAYGFYQRIPTSEIETKVKDRIFKSLLYTGDNNMRDEFHKVQAPAEMKDYYDKILVCYTGIKNCVTEFKAYSGTTGRVLAFKQMILDYEKIPGFDPNSKYAKIAGEFFKNGDYLASALIAEETLTKRPGYASMLQLSGYSWYELGNYKKANDFLQKYYTMDPKDVNVTYVLGLTNFYLEDYISSNLYLNAAVVNGYRPKNELERRLAYNYYIIGDKKNMLKVFRYILNESDATMDDFVVATYTSIEESDETKGMIWVNRGIKRFPEADMLYAFRGWLHLINNEQESAMKDISKSITINPKNACALYHLGVLAFEKNDYTTAKEFFDDVVEVDNGGTFGDMAKWKLKEMDEAKKKQEDEAAQSTLTQSGN